MSKGGNKQQVDVPKGAKIIEVEDEEDIVRNPLEDLPPVILRRVKALKNLQKTHLDLEKKYRDEVEQLELKYQKLYDPLFEKRASIVNGQHEPTDEEARVEGEETQKVEKSDKDSKGIPKFWLIVMKNNGNIGETITEQDEEALGYLTDIKYSTLEGDKKGFVLTFHFAENPFFSDSVLTKTYYLAEDEGLFGELVFDHAEGTKINWKPNKNLTVKLVKKQQKPPRGARGGKGGKGGSARVQTVEEPCESFFLFFTPPNVDKEDADEEEDELFGEMLEADFEYGCVFKDKLIPHAALWFTGEAAEYDDFGDDMYDGEEFGDEDDEDEDEDDLEEEEEEEEEKPRKGARGGNQPPAKKGGAGGGGGGGGKPFAPAPGGAGQPQQPECKQQ